MATSKKNEIMQSFIKLLNIMPFDKITVKDIAEDCGINRNTFYYNYDDIYAVIDEMFQIEINRIVEQNIPYSSWKEGLLDTADFALKNKKAVYHLYNSVRRSQLEKYFENVLYDVTLKYVHNKSVDLDVTEDDIEFVSRFYCYALIGLVNRWLDTGMKEDFTDLINKTAMLFDINIDQALKTISNAN